MYLTSLWKLSVHSSYISEAAVASDFPVDEGNLSSGGDEIEKEMFITQSSFKSITQEVDDVYFCGLNDVSLSEVSSVKRKDLCKLVDISMGEEM